MAICENNNLWGWGLNRSGRLGNGSTTDSLVPIQIGETTTSWKSVFVGSWHTVAICTDGTLWAWGSNHSGQVGDNTTINRHRPVQVSTYTDWQSVSVGGARTMGIRKDGTLWAWGLNEGGLLGDDTYENRHIPTPIGKNRKWQSVSVNIHHTLAVCKDGTLWSWGSNIHGSSGDGTAGVIFNQHDFPMIHRTVPSPTNTMKVIGLPDGVTLQGPLFLEDDGSGELTLLIDETAQAGTHELTLFVRGVKSNVFTLTICNENTFTVTMENCGDGAFVSHSSAAQGTEITIYAGTRDGYVFTNWTSSPAALTFTSAGALQTTFAMPSENVTVTADWQPASVFSVTFDTGDGFFATTPPAIIFATGGALGILPRATEMSNPGYRFTGWYDCENNRWRDYDEATSDVTLTARWVQSPANFHIGDTNGDRRVTSEDATRIARHLVGHDVYNFCLLAADINGDGRVTIADITLLLRWLIGHDVHHLVAH
jgi:uncharacterized repeat protein (TIGR02543 family)